MSFLILTNLLASCLQTSSQRFESLTLFPLILQFFFPFLFLFLFLSCLFICLFISLGSTSQSCWLIFPCSIYFVKALCSQPSAVCLCQTVGSEFCQRSEHDDGHICGKTCSALFCLTEEIRQILSSSAQFRVDANLSINTMIDLQQCVCVCVCREAGGNRCFTRWGKVVLYVAYVVHMHCFLLLCWTWRQ